MAKTVKKSRTRSSHSVTRPKDKRIPNVIEENKAKVTSQWLKRVSANRELSTVSLSETGRKDHVPDLLDEAIAHACGHSICGEERQKAAEGHGTLRFHQGYSVAVLILEAQLLQDVIAECIRDNVHALDISHLIPDIAKISDTITAELRESVRAYMNQLEWKASRPLKRSG